MTSCHSLTNALPFPDALWPRQHVFAAGMRQHTSRRHMHVPTFGSGAVIAGRHEAGRHGGSEAAVSARRRKRAGGQKQAQKGQGKREASHVSLLAGYWSAAEALATIKVEMVAFRASPKAR